MLGLGVSVSVQLFSKPTNFQSFSGANGDFNI
jgi:hypothetical protein